MSISKNEFMILNYLTKNDYSNQRDIADELSISLGTANKTLKDLKEKELLNDDLNISSKGFESLEPYKVKRAIIMAAGFGSRMVPVTLTTPKPLVKVNGKRIVDSLIDALLENGVDDITIVRGYLKHKFNELKIKYPMIKFVDNDLYNEANNIYSIYLVKDNLENAYIFEGDLVLYNPEPIEKYHYTSDFLAFPVKESDDWCFETKNNIITNFVRGGKDTYQEVGISYWNSNDGRLLRKDIEEVLNSPGGKELLWENVPLVKRNKNYHVQIKECRKEDIIEIDTFSELCALDPSYKNYRTPNINIEKTVIKNICNTLKCEESEISNIEFMKIGLTNVSFKFSVNGINYVYRRPGDNTKKFINRKSEVFSEKIAKKLGLDNTVIHIDETGWKISKYLENSTHIDPYNKDDQKRSMEMIHKLHDAKIVSEYDFDYIKEADRFVKMFMDEDSFDFSPYEELHERARMLDNQLKTKGYEKVLCHNDFWFWNILKDNDGNLTLIDWEYSGNAYPASDVVYYTSSLNFTNKDYIELAELYEGHALSKEERYYYNSVMVVVMWYWFVWALFKETNGKTIEDKQIWYDKVISALKALE